MKQYKLVNGKEVQEKAFRLGYSWTIYKEEPAFLEQPFLILLENGVMVYQDDHEEYIEDKIEEITQKDFLALEEPITVGDLCLVGSGDHSNVVIRVFDIVGDQVNTEIDTDGDEEYFDIKDLKKLTEDQMRVLGLKHLSEREMRILSGERI